MNPTMLAAAQIIARARDVISEGTATCPECRRFSETHTVTPDQYVDALAEALDDYDGLRDLEDMEETEASFGAGLKRDILRGCGR